MNYPLCYYELLAHLLTFMEMPAHFDKLLFSHLIPPITYDEDTLLFNPDQVANMAFWPVIGFLRTYKKFKPEEDCEKMEQITKHMSVPKRVFLLEDCFMNGAFAGCFMEIAKGSTVVGFSNSSFVEMAEEMPEVALLALKVISSSRIDLQMRTDICKVPCDVGYQMLLDNFTNVEAFVYQKHIATYMGTTPGNLSRVRAVGGYCEEHLRK
jgi:hypothetical protein